MVFLHSFHVYVLRSWALPSVWTTAWSDPSSVFWAPHFVAVLQCFTGLDISGKLLLKSLTALSQFGLLLCKLSFYITLLFICGLVLNLVSPLTQKFKLGLQLLLSALFSHVLHGFINICNSSCIMNTDSCSVSTLLFYLLSPASLCSFKHQLQLSVNEPRPNNVWTLWRCRLFSWISKLWQIISVTLFTLRRIHHCDMFLYLKHNSVGL